MLISRRFWTSKRFCCGRNWFCHGKTSQCCHFLDWFSQLGMVLDRNYRYVQNRLEIISVNLLIKVMYIVCSPNGNKKHLSTQFLENDEIIFHLAAMSQCEQEGEGHIWDTACAD